MSKPKKERVMEMYDDALAKRIEELLLGLVEIYTPTGDGREKDIEAFYRAWFGSVDYFKTHPEYAGFFKIPDDHLDRSIPWCLLRGEGSETVVLLHHSDVVDTDDYKALRDLALHPHNLMEAFEQGKMSLPEEAAADLKSGDWLFGRGVADMKGGAAIQMALVERYAESGLRKGNIVMLGLPDEENLSAGGRGAPLILKELRDRYGLDYVLALNSEPTDRKRGASLPKLHVGSIGKVMPLIYARGTLSHAGMVYEGLNPIRIMAEVVRKLDLTPDLIDEIEGVSSPAPTFLYLKDRKEIYDVSLPLSASGYMSIMFLSRSPQEILTYVREKCVEGFEAAIAAVQESYDAYVKRGGAREGALPWRANVKLYSELHAEALRDSGEAFTKNMEALSAELAAAVTEGRMSFVEASHAVVERTLLHVKDLSPCIVLAVVPPYYPVVGNSMLGERGARVNALCDGIIERARREFDDEYMKYYIVGMSDLSYFMQPPASGNERYMRDNMLLWGSLYSIPFAALEEISMPVLNVGPWGKGIHKYDERVYKKDLFDRMPDLTIYAIDTILGNA